MRVLYYTTSYYSAHGGSIQAIELFRQLEKNNSITELEIFPKRSQRRQNFGKQSQYKDYLKSNSLFQVLFFYRRNQFYLKELKIKINEFQPDVVIMQIDSNFLQVRCLKQKFPKVLFCTQINGSPFDEQFDKIAFKKFFIRLQRKIYTFSDLNVFVSELSKNGIMGDLVIDKRDVVIYNGTDLNKFYPVKEDIRSLRKELDYPEEAFIVGYVGTLDYHKRIDILIKAFQDLRVNNKEVYLAIIGDGPAYSDLKFLVNELKLMDRVTFKGWIVNEKMNGHLNSFDIAVHHYAKDYMNPLKVYEYLSAGLPVIAPDIPSIKAIFTDEKDLLITNGERKDISEKLEILLKDHKLRSELSNNLGLIRKLEGRFTWRKYVEKLMAYIEEKVNV